MQKALLPLLSFVVLYSCKDNKTTTEPAATPMVKTATTTADNKPPQAEFADAKYTDMGKQMMMQMENGDVDKWVANFADNAVYSWSNGDSLAGKKAITDYWTNRRKNVIESLHFSNDIWLPIKVNTPQRGPDMPGVWLLNWYQVNVKYKNGKALQFWVHHDYHYNNDNKVDRTVMYIDRAPVNAAVGMK
ncbi:nuclear transport factor 2 family protein [Flavisolibacter ginsenosidimutans]|uniref:Nuclear transport factor 2 family protein n=1 Tax=Flavisolibacter ginsenosidimutans TaxID=661481 RepID=A0A5B8UMS9_9BACT|nr:nuclear transport factor 2 family protein [Flavisolibacter ginsenosidimutans]QEC57509.1 nuclear transport factor 2 family protein [Flavisolibacter ginsenosidimutans]